jgi:hypothetical protein
VSLRLTWETARITRRAPRYVVEDVQAGKIDIPTAHQFTESYLTAPQPVKRLVEDTHTHRASTVNEIKRAYEEEGRGKTTRFTEMRDDKSISFMSGDRVPLGEANELHLHKWMRERQVQHLDHASLVKYDWMADQVGELYVIPKGESVMMSPDDDTLVFVIANPPPDLLRMSGRKGKCKLGLEVIKKPQD